VEALSLFPPLLALVVAVWTRNVYWALGLAILVSETLLAGGNPLMGVLESVDRSVGVFASEGNTRILLFCLIIGALMAYMRTSGGVAAMVAWLRRSGLAATPRRAGLITALSGIVIFVETNISLLSTGLLGRYLFDRLKVSRERLAYIIDSTCAPVSVLILLNGWGFFILQLMAENGVSAPLKALVWTVPFNFYPLLTLALVFLTVGLNRTFGPLARLEARSGPARPVPAGDAGLEDMVEAPSRAIYMWLPMLVLVGGTLGFMAWTGDGNPLRGSGSTAILWSVVLATGIAFLALAHSGRRTGELLQTGFDGMGGLLPAVSVIFLAFVLGNSLSALGTGRYIAQLAADFPAPALIPALLFLVAGFTSFTTGTSWGTYGILVPIAVPLAVGAGVPLPLAMAAVMGGGVFGDHCSPISDTTIIASLAAGCDHFDHVRTQLPYALAAGGAALLAYVGAGLVALS